MFDLNFYDNNDYYYDFEYTKSELDCELEDLQFWEQSQAQFEDYYYIESLKRSGQND